MPAIKRIGVVIKPHQPEALETLCKLTEWLTQRAIAEYRLECAGWVANVLDADMSALQENIAALQQRIAAPLLGIIPYQAQPEVHAVATYLNVGLLEKK